MSWTFEPRWKEMLVCTNERGQRLVLDFGMGVDTAHLPTEPRWRRMAPDWARDAWAEVHRDLADWCRRKSIPLAVDDQATVTLTE